MLIIPPAVFPGDLQVGNKNGDKAQYFTQDILAKACQYLGVRHRHIIPGGGARAIASTASPASLTYDCVARREQFARGLRIRGFYEISTPAAELSLTVQCTSPAFSAITKLMPSLTFGNPGGIPISEFSHEFLIGDGAQTASGDIEFQVIFSFGAKSLTDALVILYVRGFWFEPEAFSQVEVTT